MAIGTTAALALGIGSAVAGTVGSVASAFGKQNPTYDPSGINAVKMGDQSALGAAGQTAATGALSSMQGLSSDPSFQANSDLASLLQQYSSTGGVPSASDVSTSQGYAQSQFAPQQLAMQQQFQSQMQQANQQAALSGRGVNDPVLRAKLAQQQTQQSAQLQAQQGAFASQYANQLSQNRVSYAEGRANALTSNFQQQLGLANNIFSQGLQAQSTDYNQRMQQYQSDLSKQEQIAGGQFQSSQMQTSVGQRIGSALTGTIGSVGAGFNVFGALNGAGAKNPFAPAATDPGNTRASASSYYANLYGAPRV